MYSNSSPLHQSSEKITCKHVDDINLNQNSTNNAIRNRQISYGHPTCPREVGIETTLFRAINTKNNCTPSLKAAQSHFGNNTHVSHDIAIKDLQHNTKLFFDKYTRKKYMSLNSLQNTK